MSRKFCSCTVNHRRQSDPIASRPGKLLPKTRALNPPYLGRHIRPGKRRPASWRTTRFSQDLKAFLQGIRNGTPFLRILICSYFRHIGRAVIAGMFGS